MIPNIEFSSQTKKSARLLASYLCEKDVFDRKEVLTILDTLGSLFSSQEDESIIEGFRFTKQVIELVNNEVTEIIKNNPE